MRYYLLREVPLGIDGDFTFESLFGRFNAELANDLGNLVNRSLTLIGESPLQPAFAHGDVAESDKHAAFARPRTMRSTKRRPSTTAMAPSRALEAIWKLVREANRYVDASSRGSSRRIRRKAASSRTYSTTSRTRSAWSAGW